MKINAEIKRNLKNYLTELLKKEKEKVTLISAHPFTSHELETLYKHIPDLRKSQINFVVDKNVIAGFAVKIGSRVIDLTLSERLNKLKNQMYELD